MTAGVDGLAATLIRQGVDRVVAMQTSVTDGYATALARRFYRALASDPGCSVAEALADARRSVDEQHRATVRPAGS